MFKGLPRIDDTVDVSTSPQLCSLYFKGLVSKDSSAGFGVAILGKKDDLLFQMKGPIHHDSTITSVEAELTALKRGLIEAASLGITHISIYCDNYPIYELVTGRYVSKENKTDVLMNDVQQIRDRFASSFPIFVARNSIRFAYELALETIVYEIRIPMNPLHQAKPSPKATCSICLDDDLNANQMFCVNKCRHRFCSECMKQHIEVRLLQGSVMRCPHYRCKSILTFGSCGNLLTPNLRMMWQERIKENSIPVTERIYCPNPRCSALMSVTELSQSTKEVGVRTCCFKCGQLFCINCKVSWHSNLSCDDYKRLHPYPTENDTMIKGLANQRMWRQCGKCQHMIELSQGCVRVKCRCGHSFCYRCGAEAGRCQHGHGLPPWPQPPPEQPSPMWFSILFGVVFILIGLGWYLILK